MCNLRAVIAALVICAGLSVLNAGEKAVVEDIEVEIPQNWIRTKSRTGCAGVFKSKEIRAIGKIKMQDNFTIRIAPASGQTLDNFKAAISKTLKLQASKLNEFVKQTISKADVDIGLKDIGKYSISKVKVNNLDALKIHMVSVLDVHGMVLKNIAVTHVFNIDNKFYIVATALEASQEKAVRPLAEKFISSIKLSK